MQPNVPALLFVCAVAATASAQESGGYFSCPMHADIRRTSAGTCPRCGMALVWVARVSGGPFRLLVETDPPQAPSRVPLSLRLSLIDPVTNTLARHLAIVHEHPLHLFVVSEDLDELQHLHPVQSPDGSFSVKARLPRPGRYQLFADFVPEGSPPQLVSRALLTSGYARPLRVPSLPPPGPKLARDRELRASLSQLLVPAGKEVLLKVLFRDADGRSIDGIEPYLGAPLHAFAVSNDLRDAVHAHAEKPADGSDAASEMTLPLRLPRPARYRLWLQIQRAGVVFTFGFIVEARS